MVQQITKQTENNIIYPDSDGQPMADNTKQFRLIVTIKENLELLFTDEPFLTYVELGKLKQEAEIRAKQAEIRAQEAEAKVKELEAKLRELGQI